MTEMTLVQALNSGLDDAMKDDKTIVLMGQDIGVLGGVFRVTDGLAAKYGRRRVFDTPLAESAIVGTGIGLALRGYRPVVEIQFDGFVYPAFDQIVSQLAKMHARSRGRLTLPMVIRIPAAGGIGAVEHHSESNEAYFAHTAGLRVVSCASPSDGYHQLRAAIRSNDPVIFLEPKRRYWDKGEVDLQQRPPPLGSAVVVREGEDATVIAHGPTVLTALGAAAAAEEDGYSIEVVDLRSISPLDLATLTASARKTGRVVIVHEACTFAGIGAEISAGITESCFRHLLAPVARVGAYDLPYPPSRVEDAFLPDVDRVLEAIDSTLIY